MNSEYMVLVSNVHKSYSGQPVLNGLSMRISTGSMYGLLGPSGCGKTTLLKCILGRMSVDSGAVQLAVTRWKHVGFMPQNTSLHAELRVGELLRFYGSVFGLAGDRLSVRAYELADLLDLPPLTSLVADCSGGQKRRISLAVTLLHSPDLLLLDEPTVGLDPLLCQKIWSHLKFISQTQRKTVLLTTHYMEEARSLDQIGLMRGGVMLAEGPPAVLLAQLKCSTLDDAFLELCKRQEVDLEGDIVKSAGKPSYHKSEVRLRNDYRFSLNRLSAQIYKNYKWTIRNIPVTLFILLLPVICSCLVGLIFKDLNFDFKVGYYSEEFDNATCDDVRVRLSGCRPSPPFSCNFISILQNKRPTERFSSLEEGLGAVRRGETFALIYFPQNFTSTVVERLGFVVPKKNETMLDAAVQIWMDHTVYTVAWHAHIDLYQSFQNMMEMKCQECGINSALARTPISMQKSIFGERNTLRSKIYPHFLIALLFYTTFIYTSASLIMEKSSGVLERVQLNGMTTAELLSGNFLVQLVVAIIQNILALLTVHWMFDEGYLGSMWLMYAILLLTELFGSVFGILVLTFTSEPYIVNYIGVGAILTAILTNGLIWPPESVHWTLRNIVKHIPVNMASSSYSQVMLHGFHLSHHLVYPGLIYVLASTLVLALIAFCRIRIKNQL